MGKIRKTYSKEYKLDVVKKYLDEGWTKHEIMDHFHISSSMLHRWVTHYKNEGIQGLEEKRGKTKGLRKGRPRKILSPLNKNWNVYVRRMNI
ncbi:helix-turn-helix domain-containing protein [Parageobacillus thermoglucosidasius]|uniref:helix-turn-helix domain-containing protein n=1 Tax=Parageobacillus thermoglucosidasius TaxID=1426 RepID=UPI001E3F60DB|nr:helix-turn-helix domain-containing protein [Parageobacillus thermoglucosidasius]